jgi:hypothetical protein
MKTIQKALSFILNRAPRSLHDYGCTGQFIEMAPEVPASAKTAPKA